jgi:hypothetical protein
MLPRRELANLRCGGALITSSVDCCRAGYMWAVRLGLLGSPRRCRTALVSRPVSTS